MRPNDYPCGHRSPDLKAIGGLHAEARKRVLSKLSKGLAHPARVEIVGMLLNKPPEERCVCGDIVKALPLAQSSVSQHLKILKETGWVFGDNDGQYVRYCLVDGIIKYYVALIEQSFQDEV